MLGLTLDPGIRHAGIAVFRDGELQLARYVVNPAKEGDGPEAVRSMVHEILHTLALRNYSASAFDWYAGERMQVYAGSKAIGDPNDLVPLGGLLHAVACALHRDTRVIEYRPAAWKGQVPPNETARRILARLQPHEVQRIEGVDRLLAALVKAEARGKSVKDLAAREHNALDAVGIGLKYVDRFEPHRVIAR